MEISASDGGGGMPGNQQAHGKLLGPFKIAEGAQLGKG